MVTLRQRTNEMENAIERAVVLGSNCRIRPDDLPESVLETNPVTAEHLLPYLDRQSVTTVVGRCYTTERHTAYAPIGQWLRSNRSTNSSWAPQRVR